MWATNSDNEFRDTSPDTFVKTLLVASSLLEQASIPELSQRSSSIARLVATVFKWTVECSDLFVELEHWTSHTYRQILSAAEPDGDGDN